MTKLILAPKFEELTELVDKYGYYSDITPMCGNDNCPSELGHLIEDWLDNSSGLRDMQKELAMKDAAFEYMIASIYLTDAVEFKEDGESDES